MPAESWYFPKGHETQVSNPVVEYVPGSQTPRRKKYQFKMEFENLN